MTLETGTSLIKGTVQPDNGPVQNGQLQGRNRGPYCGTDDIRDWGQSNKRYSTVTVGFQDNIPVQSGQLQGRDGGPYCGIDDISDWGQSYKRYSTATVGFQVNEPVRSGQLQGHCGITYLSEVINYRDMAG